MWWRRRRWTASWSSASPRCWWKSALGVDDDDDIDGRSLVPLLQADTAGWRKSFLIEYFSDTTMPRMLHMGYQALRTERWKYIRYTELEGMDELYDLIKDPYEMHNVIRRAGRGRAGLAPGTGRAGLGV